VFAKVVLFLGSAASDLLAARGRAFLVALFFYMFAAFHGIRNAVAASPGVSFEK
jgi:hypothetical protein